MATTAINLPLTALFVAEPPLGHWLRFPWGALVLGVFLMFLLSPLYWLARQGKGIEGMTDDEKMALMHKTHQVPPTPLNLPLTAIFAAETPLGHWLRSPWGA